MAWISDYGYFSLPGTGEEEHDELVTFHSLGNSEYRLEMSWESAMEFGAPRGPDGEVMFSSAYSDMIGIALDEHLGSDPIKNPPFDIALDISKIDWTVDYMPRANGKRRRPRARVQRRLLRMQHERCLYCILPFGSWVRRRSETVQLRVEWDHKIPLSLTQSNDGREFAAACQICNRLKSSLVFRTIEDARSYINNRRVRKGWKVLVEQNEEIDEWAEWSGRLVAFRSTTLAFQIEISEEILFEYGPPLDPYGATMVYAPNE